MYRQFSGSIICGDLRQRNWVANWRAAWTEPRDCGHFHAPSVLCFCQEDGRRSGGNAEKSQTLSPQGDLMSLTQHRALGEKDILPQERRVPVPRKHNVKHLLLPKAFTCLVPQAHATPLHLQNFIILEKAIRLPYAYLSQWHLFSRPTVA